MKNISTEKLIKELEERKKAEIPKLAKTMNDVIKALKAFGIDVEYYNDNYKLEKIECKEVNGKLRVFYEDEEI